MLFDSDAVNAIEFHGHGSTCSEGVAADIVGHEATVFQVKGFDSVLEGFVDVAGKNLLGLANVLVVGGDGGVGVSGVGHDVGDPSGKGSDWAGGCSSALLVDALASVSILLVADGECGLVCLEKLTEWGSVGDDGVILTAEGDVFDSKSLCSLPFLGVVMGVLAHP